MRLPLRDGGSEGVAADHVVRSPKDRVTLAGPGLDVDGVYAALEFAGQFDTCSRESLDIANCAPDGKIDLSDILAVLDSLQGVDPCRDNRFDQSCTPSLARVAFVVQELVRTADPTPCARCGESRSRNR